MSATPWEVLSKYAQRYKIPRRRPDRSIKGEAELADETLTHGRKRLNLVNGCFFVEKRGDLVHERTAPLEVYVGPHQALSAEAERAS